MLVYPKNEYWEQLTANEVVKQSWGAFFCESMAQELGNPGANVQKRGIPDAV